MTTAAYDGESLAVSVSLSNGNVHNWYQALFSGGKGKTAWHAALCGEPVDNLCVRDWLDDMLTPKPIKRVEEGEDPELLEQPAVAEDFYGLVLTSEGHYELTSDLVLIPLSGKAAVGTGWQFAASAMDHGKNATEALQYASTRDPLTTGDVSSVQQLRIVKE